MRELQENMKKLTIELIKEKRKGKQNVKKEHQRKQKEKREKDKMNKERCNKNIKNSR